MNKKHLIAFTILFLFSLSPKAEERVTTSDIKLYKAPSEKKSNLRHWIIKESIIKVLEKKGTLWIKVKITSEPYKKGRNDRKGSSGWIKSKNFTKKTKRAITIDSLFSPIKKTKKSKDNNEFKKTIKLISNNIRKKPEPKVDINCETEPTYYQIERSFLPGCNTLKSNAPYESLNAKSELEKCLGHIIKKITSNTERKGRIFKNHHGEKFPALSRKKVFKNMFKKLNSYEQEFAAMIFTSLGEAKDISLEHRKYEYGKKRNHLEEMMAIMLVLENRRDKINKNLRLEKLKINKIKKNYKGQSSKKIIKILKREQKKLEKKAKSLQKNELYKRKGIRVSIIKLKQKIRLLKSHLKSDKKQVNTLDMALDSSGKQFNVYFPQTKPPLYPHWYKVMSKDFQKFHQLGIDAFLQYKKNKNTVKDLNKNILHYYANHIARPKWAKPSKVSIPVFYNQGKKLRLKTDPVYSNSKDKSAPYSCQEKLTKQQRKKRKKIGHCFYEDIPYVYKGHPFNRGSG